MGREFVRKALLTEFFQALKILDMTMVSGLVAKSLQAGYR
jgi:hypothetical protein